MEKTSIPGRSEDDKMMVFGIHPVADLADAGRGFERIFIQRDSKNPSLRTLRKLLESKGIAYSLVPVEKLNRLTRGNHQGVVGFLSLVEYARLEDVVPGLFGDKNHPLIVMLDRVTDVRNFGAVCRTAECMGVGAVVVPESGGAMIHGDAMRASAGALGRITVCREHNLKQVLEYLHDSGFLIAGCTEKATREVHEQDLNRPVCLVLGSEEDGISPEYLRRCDVLLKIPMIGETASLNVSVAAAIMMYETRRQQSKG
jgi:23S rRNA (guanosine2251-2'-O)-methyltransferase